MVQAAPLHYIIEHFAHLTFRPVKPTASHAQHFAHLTRGAPRRRLQAVPSLAALPARGDIPVGARQGRPACVLVALVALRHDRCRCPRSHPPTRFRCPRSHPPTRCRSDLPSGALGRSLALELRPRRIGVSVAGCSRSARNVSWFAASRWGCRSCARSPATATDANSTIRTCSAPVTSLHPSAEDEAACPSRSPAPSSTADSALVRFVGALGLPVIIDLSGAMRYWSLSWTSPRPALRTQIWLRR